MSILHNVQLTFSIIRKSINLFNEKVDTHFIFKIVNFMCNFYKVGAQ